MPRRRPEGAPPPRRRAPDGAVDGTPLLLRMPAELREAARTAALAEGCTEAEWWRRAGRDRVLRQRAGARSRAP